MGGKVGFPRDYGASAKADVLGAELKWARPNTLENSKW